MPDVTCLWRRKRKVLRLERKNDGVMDDKSGDDDTDEVRRPWRSDESGRGRSRRGWRSQWESSFQR